MGFEPKLTDLHNEYIKNCLVRFISSPTQIKDLIADKEIAEAAGFEPVTVSTQLISKKLIQWKKNEKFMEGIATERAKYLLDFSDIPLAHTKERLAVLQARYLAIPEMIDAKGGKLTSRVCLDYEMKILRQMSEESGENLEKIAEILARGGTLHVNLTLQDKILGHYKEPDDKPGT